MLSVVMENVVILSVMAPYFAIYFNQLNEPKLHDYKKDVHLTSNFLGHADDLQLPRGQFIWNT